ALEGRQRTQRNRMNIARRQFLKTSALGLGSMALSTRSGLAVVETPRSSLGAFDVVTLGQTGIKTSRVSMGTGVRGGMRESNLTRSGAANAQKLMREIF